MRRNPAVLTIFALALLSFPALAHGDKHAHSAAAAPKPSTITGEVVDTGCYLGHAARGEKHASCAARCIGNGMPMGLLADDGSLYLITLNHDDADPYNSLKGMAGKKVTVTGKVMARSGMKAIDVTAVRTATAAR